jgi:PAS domain S-box-containing protein
MGFLWVSSGLVVGGGVSTVVPRFEQSTSLGMASSEPKALIRSVLAQVDANGKRLYNRPAYASVLGYNVDELEDTTVIEPIHPEDRQPVQEAASNTLQAGVGRRIEYRVCHKGLSWRVLESTASAILDGNRKVEKR